MIEISVLFPFFFISLQLQLSLSHVIKRSRRFKNLETQLGSLVISLLNYLTDIQKTYYLSKWHVTSPLLLFINCTCCSRVQCCVHIKLTNTGASRCLLCHLYVFRDLYIFGNDRGKLRSIFKAPEIGGSLEQFKSSLLGGILASNDQTSVLNTDSPTGGRFSSTETSALLQAFPFFLLLVQLKILNVDKTASKWL